MADFPEMRQRLDLFDGCPNQFAYCDNYYQIAVWRAKTASWAKHRLALAADAATATAAIAAATAATAAVEGLTAASCGLEVVRAAARGMPLAHSQLGAVTTIHRLAGAVAKAAEKLTAAAAETSAALLVDPETPVLSAAAASRTVTAAATTVRLAQAASKAADTAAIAAVPTGLKGPISAVASAARRALAAASVATATVTAASDAIDPTSPMDVDGENEVPLSPAVAAALAATPALDGIIRMAIQLVEHHGKSACDGNSNTITRAIKAAIEQNLLGPTAGTRELVLFLAEHKPITLIPKSAKRGWEAIGRIFYGFMNTDLFTKSIVPDTDGRRFKDSTKHHSFVGRITSGQVYAKGEMQACHEFCPCTECLLGRYASCSLRAQMGAMHRVAVPWVSGAPLRQLEELTAWGEMLKADMLVAFTADKNDAGEWPDEGNYYLALLRGPAYPVPESQVQASDRFEAGWLVADAQWLVKVGDSPRSYKPGPEQTLVVSEMIRLSTLRWDKIDKRSPRLGQTLYYLGEDTHNMIQACVRDQDA